jgi:nucleoporin p58/p45
MSGGGGLFGKPAATGGGGIFGSSAGTTQQKSTFFSGSQPSGFGGQNTMSGGFGAQSTTSGVFGAQGSTQGAFGASSSQFNLQNGTSSINFNGYKDKDHGGDSKNLITLNAITAEPTYQQFSLEELRMADYVLKKQGKVNFPIGAQPAQNQPTTGFGSGGSFGAPSTQSTSGGLFGSSAAQPKTGGLFSSNTSSTGGLFGKIKFFCFYHKEN